MFLSRLLPKGGQQQGFCNLARAVQKTVLQQMRKHNPQVLGEAPRASPWGEYASSRASAQAREGVPNLPLLIPLDFTEAPGEGGGGGHASPGPPFAFPSSPVEPPPGTSRKPAIEMPPVWRVLDIGRDESELQKEIADVLRPKAARLIPDGIARCGDGLHSIIHAEVDYGGSEEESERRL
uniref:Uncharacterized protein n=1 Tax=Chromera velia CCMP2878 TaxID=1169474 RepID=A0A0G4IE87_9ALVE|eukprot:Cvel_13600.t1-p1 / transcript=Cvel_13600.t1 / gene=Cvel_13600 / organism=Chromera_velia_CCMP2878 / gene_product=hypothetical protein / transcript_product=hypothetical protein / location=Cvel_scaffold936:12803-19196(-) / protein_length=179 / sequence_SO=supercontig / SO=protein_coding / is_pseudo=false